MTEEEDYYGGLAEQDHINKMKQEENLSNKLWFKGRYIDNEDVKEAVKKLKERFDGEGNIYNKENFHEEIDKIFGPDLI